jgi:hypothetical protein
MKIRPIPEETGMTTSGTHTGPERRDHASREALLARVTAEFHNLPGLRLTAAQARRLFGLRDDICERVLNTLVETSVLERDDNGAFARRGIWP